MKEFIFIFILALSTHVFAVKESEITQCKKDSDCMIVPYRHCCGATKKAIGKKFLKEYNKNKSWRKFDNPTICAVAGVCVSDEKIKDAKCEAGQCQLRF